MDFMQKKFEKIQNLYSNFSLEMLSKGHLMLKDTGIGYWGISPLSELFELFQCTKLNNHNKFIDLGSGDGRAVVLASLFTDATGIEYDKELHAHSRRLAKTACSKAKLINGDFMAHSLKDYDYIFINPDKGISGTVEQKLKKEMKKGAKLVVFSPHSYPEELERINTLDIQGTLVSIFRK
jgi:protein-L-isoaspartate O-methyltransferase